MAEFEEDWREWAGAEPRIDEQQIRIALPDRLSFGMRRRNRTALLAAAAALVLAAVGLITGRMGREAADPTRLADAPAIVHPLDENVVLFISKDTEPVYIVLAEVPAGRGDQT